MKKLENQELNNIKGGAVSAAAVTGIIGAIVFVIGIIDSIVRPLKCR